MRNIEVVKEGLSLELCPPDFNQGYYRGTRFDHSGIFRRIVLGGKVIADEWFDSYDPYRHDAVCGASEEFTQTGYEEASVGGLFLKPGVGLLCKEDEAAYDRFRLYKVADSGNWTVTQGEDSVTFRHELAGDGWGYEYEKVVRLLGGGMYEILHRLRNTGEKVIAGQTYNHNFFTFGDSRPGPGIEIDFTFQPSGNWRSEYDNVALTESGIRFSRDLVQGESVFMGDLKPAYGAKMSGEIYSQRSGESSVQFDSDRPFDFIVFWSNHRVSCIEPYISYDVKPGEIFTWKYTYKLK